MVYKSIQPPESILCGTAFYCNYSCKPFDHPLFGVCLSVGPASLPCVGCVARHVGAVTDPPWRIVICAAIVAVVST